MLVSKFGVLIVMLMYGTGSRSHFHDIISKVISCPSVRNDFSSTILPWSTTDVYIRYTCYFVKASIIDENMFGKTFHIKSDSPTDVCFSWNQVRGHFEGTMPKGPYPPCLRMSDRALLAGYPRFLVCILQVSFCPNNTICCCQLEASV